ncbi:Fic family protein [Mucilaginibacter aquaedulcis]|uniref:Fic family protein n=1 Tax=Mucilaginibacter aquaedulcis TaxID=1187081 RepID=UPI0025B62011|nr:Fic family protein [Mucilaginibacter aquaedulcis]MDN3546874.1 Fic family protein [Mucilaginibacter aquaedulcis]
MNLTLEIEFSKAPILQEVDALKKQIDDMRPLPPDVEGRVMQKLRLDWNYNSNAIEGNKLSYGETVAFLMEGITAKGKPLKDHLDIRGHNQAINFLMDLVKDTRPISEADIRALHEMILVEPYEVKAQTAEGALTSKWIKLGEYKILPNHVQTATGETHYYTSPEETPIKMRELMEWYNQVSVSEEVHPVVAAALFHHKFVAIHPFDDGNGRLSRILMNLILMQKGYPPVVVKMDDRKNYYSLLSRADVEDNWPFIEYIAERLESSLQLYLKAAKGGDIDEDEDIDKEIALFKMDILNNTNVRVERSNSLIDKILDLDIEPLIDKFVNKANQFNDLFFDVSNSISLVDSTNSYKYPSLSQFLITTNAVERDKIFHKLERLVAVVEYRKFKNSENDFNSSGGFIVQFEQYYYEIIDFGFDVILRNKYDERLSSVDQSKVIRSFINYLKNDINANLKTESPKS